VVVDRARRDEQPLGDLGVPEPLDEKGKHIELAGRDVVLRRAYCASRVPQMCPNCVRVFNTQTTIKYQFAGTLFKPSDGLEPSTPSLPWRFWGGTGGHGRALAITFLLQIGRLNVCRSCPHVPRLMYPSRTRGSLPVCKTTSCATSAALERERAS
jgi:hypothetical protein